MVSNHCPSVSALRGWPDIIYILGNSGGKVSNVGGNKIGHWGEKTTHMKICLILDGDWARAVWISRPNYGRFCLWGWMKNKVDKRKVDTWDELLTHILDAAACIEHCEDQLKQHTIYTWVAKCIEVDGISEHSLWMITDLSFPCNKFVI
jgi:hypothetical protein